MSKKFDGYTPVGPLAAGLGLAVTGLASLNPATVALAGPIGTMVAGFASGINISDDETIKAKFDRVMNETWHYIFVDYHLHENCFKELKEDVIGEGTSTEEFVSNSSRKKFEESLADVIQTILKRHQIELNWYSDRTWDVDYINHASKDIASRLVKSINGVFKNEDLLKILKAIDDGKEEIKRNINNSREADKSEYETIIAQYEKLVDEIHKIIIELTSIKSTVLSSSGIMYLPASRVKASAPCSYFVEGQRRAKDLINIYNILQRPGHALWIYGEGGIGKTELMRKFAEVYPEFECFFIQYKGSVDQTLSQNLFYLPGFEMKGIELSDIVRYQQNLSVITQYCDQLKREDRSLLIVIDNYDCTNYEKTFREMTELNIDNAFSGEKNDLKAIQALLKTGAHVVLTTHTTPEPNSSYFTYEIKEMEESDLLNVITECFPRIVTFWETPEVKEKLLDIIRFAESNTVFVTIIASAMQSSELRPLEALDRMLESFTSDHDYYTEYSGETYGLHNHMESVLKFMGLSYQNRHFLGVLSMIPSGGIDTHLFKKITETGAAQLDREQHKFIERLINNHILVQEYSQDIDDPAIVNTIIKMHPLVSDHAQWVLFSNNKKAFYNLIYQSWIIKLLYYFDDDKIENISYQDKEYKILSQIVDLCSSTEYRLQRLRDYFGEQYEEKIISRQRSLLEKACFISHQTGHVKDAVEYAERLINIEGPSSEDIESLAKIYYTLGLIFMNGGVYRLAEHYFSISLLLLNDINGLYIADSFDINSYKVEKIAEFENAISYSHVFNVFGWICEVQRKSDKALEYYEKTLKIREKVLGKDHILTGTVYSNLAIVYYVKGNYEKAMECCNKALSVQENVPEKEHPSTEKTYNTLGAIYSSLGNYKKAIVYYEKALSICERLYEKNHPTTAITYSNIGAWYLHEGNYEKAQEYCEKALAIEEKTFGEENPYTAMTYQNMGDLALKQGYAKKAFEYYEKALEVLTVILGEEHLDTMKVKRKIASLKIRVE